MGNSPLLQERALREASAPEEPRERSAEQADNNPPERTPEGVLAFPAEPEAAGQEFPVPYPEARPEEREASQAVRELPVKVA